MIIREILRTVTLNDKGAQERLETMAMRQEIRDFAKFKADISNLEASTQTAILQALQSRMQAMNLLSQGGQPGVPGQETDPELEIEQSQLQQQV